MTPSPQPPYFGVHLLLRASAEMDTLIQQVPHLAKLGVNLLLPEINYQFAYTSHPELRTDDPISKAQAKALAAACRQYGMRLTPQFMCLGHQSWAETTFRLLAQYPEFDETPGKFPNNKGIYCRSWCPQHSSVNPIVFDLMDELLEAFEADALHVGMDEVFLIASEHCPRCKGGDPAQFFAKAVNDYHDHLVKQRGVEMWMWADRFLDGEATGYGKWEAAKNGTHPAVDRVPRDIVLCDWHYTLRKDYPSVPFFLEKGFRVLPGGWREVEANLALMTYARAQAAALSATLPAAPGQLLGHLCTTWGSVKPEEMADWPPILAAAAEMRT